MKRIAFVISLLSLFCTVSQAQQDYFMFIWSDNQQPFYTQINEKTYSSSAIGHLVIPQLKDSTYSLLVGFPKKQFPEQAFVISFNKKDLDYQLKHTAEGGWVLFNAQTSETIKPRQDYLVKNTSPALGERKTGAFATLMSGLVNDSAVMYKSIAKVDLPVKPVVAEVKTDTPAVVKEEKVQTDSVIATAPAVDSVQEKAVLAAATDSLKTDSLSARQIVQPGNTTAATVVTDTTMAIRTPDSLAATKQTTVSAPPSVVIQVQEWWNDKGKGLIYYDSSAIGIDTISIVIDFDKNAGLPAPGEVIAAPARTEPVKVTTLTPDTMVVQKQELPARDLTKPAKDSTKEVAVKTIPDSPAVVAVIKEDAGKVKADTAAAAVADSKKSLLLMNSDCVNFASEFDVDKLRVKMLAAANVDDRIGVAKKVFKTKCFVTRYIRGLSELFPNDEARFKFFDAAYPFVSDTGNFRQLLDLFTDDLYIARFKSLVRM